MLQSIFIELMDQYGVDASRAAELWSEVSDNHSQKKRYYHNLNHLQDLYEQLHEVKDKLDNWNVILFTLFYHDSIYNTLKKDNEEKSAALAEKRLIEIDVGEEERQRCVQQILATKSHNMCEQSDTNYFTDADLSILGRTPDVYDIYCQQVRKEYAIFLGFLYRRGRKKVVKHFLAMDRIYKTKEFFNRYEHQARRNLQQELTVL